MTKEDYTAKIKAVFDSFGLKVHSFEAGKAAVELQEKVYEIYLPYLSINNELVYGLTKLSDPVLGMITRVAQKGEEILPIEAYYLFKKYGYEGMQAFAEPGYGAWKAKPKALKLGSSHKTVDTGFYARVSEVLIVELVRGIAQDIKRAERPGFSGFSCTNGAIQHLVSKYCIFGERVNHYSKSRVILNTEIPLGETSAFLDLASVPQDLDATSKFNLVHGVKVVNNTLVPTKKLLDSSYVLSATPLRQFVNEKRMVVQRAASQALRLFKKESPIVRNVGSAFLPGVNGIYLRSDEAPVDSYIVSASFAKRMLAVEKVEWVFRLPPNTTVIPMVSLSSEEEILMSLNLGAVPKMVAPNKPIFRYVHTELGETHRFLHGDNQQKSDLLNKEKSFVEVLAKEHFVPTSIQTSSGFWDRGPCTLCKVQGFQVTTLKVGSKVIDMYSNKGTVCEIRDDELMPIVHVDDEWGYRVDVIYNPSIYKKKVGFAYKASSLLGLSAYITEGTKRERTVFLHNKMSLKEVLATLKQKARRFFYVTYKEQTWSSAKVGLQYFLHLDHDPEKKLRFNSVERCRLTFVDRQILKKMSFRIAPDFKRANAIGQAIGIKVETSPKGDLPVFLPDSGSKDRVLEQAFEITQKLDKELLKLDISLVPPEALEGTVADQRLKDTPGFVSTEFGKVVTPPGMLAPLVGHRNSLVLPTELVCLNAIVAEQASINWVRGRYKQTESPYWESKLEAGKTKLKNLIEQYQWKLMERFLTESREGYYRKIPGIYAVATADNSLPMNTVGIPAKIYNKLRSFSREYAVIRRHPVHRVYNVVPVKIVPAQGSTIRLNEKLMGMLDGDFDGDCVEILFVRPSQVQTLARYNPEGLLKGHTDIAKKKLANRSARTSALAYDQKELKKYIALAGAIGIRLFERAQSLGYGFTQVSTLYHFMGQSALNIKHTSAGGTITAVEKLSRHFLLEDPKGQLKLSEFLEIVKGFGITEKKDLRKMAGIFAGKADKSLSILRNKVDMTSKAEVAQLCGITVPGKRLDQEQFIY